MALSPLLVFSFVLFMVLKKFPKTWDSCSGYQQRHLALGQERSHYFSDCSSGQGTFNKGRWQLAFKCPSSHRTMILGTDNGKGIVHILRDWQGTFGKKIIENVRVFQGGSYSLVFLVKTIPPAPASPVHSSPMSNKERRRHLRQSPSSNPLRPVKKRRDHTSL
jgi:hypothetical protein